MADGVTAWLALSGWVSLTVGEARVVRLLADGLTNGQIADRLVLPRQTVEGHLALVRETWSVDAR